MSKMEGGRVVDKMKATGDPRDRYDLLAKIGKGGYGYVCKALDTFNDTLVAIKIINLEDAGDEVEDVHQEIAVMKNMNCPQLTKYFASYVFGSSLWIIMEYLEAGSLLDIIKEHGPLAEPFVAYIMRELISALAYLHSERKIHRDVKAGNILVAADGSVKLADFGVTGQLTDSIDKRQTKIGTPFWMAPEVISQSAYDGCADIWSAGITAIELCKGAPPYANRIHPFQAILLIPKNPPPVLEGSFSEEFKDFVACCLVKTPKDRPSAATLLRHPFLTQVDGIPEQWSAFVKLTVEERRSKAIAMSADEALEPAQLGFDTGDWNFTVRTGMSLSNSRNGSGPNSRTHSRSHSASHSRGNSFSHAVEGSSSSSTQGATHSRSNSRSQSRGHSRSHSRSHSRGGLDISIPVRGTSAMIEGVFRSSSSDTLGSADDILSDEEFGLPTPKSAHSSKLKITSPTGTTAPVVDYEGISFPTNYPSKLRGAAPSGGKSPTNKKSLSPQNIHPSSPRTGAPPRPKSLSIADSNGASTTGFSLQSTNVASSTEWGQTDASRIAAKQEERLTNLQSEVQALVRENALLRAIAAPYIRTLDTLVEHERCNLTPGLKVESLDVPSITAGVQRAIYPAHAGESGKPVFTAEDVLNYATALTKRSLTHSSPAHTSILRPALNQLKHRVAAHKHSTGAKISAKHTPADQLNDVMGLLTVAFSALDAFDETNPVRKHQAAVAAAAHAASIPALSSPSISLTAPTPRAVHGSQSPEPVAARAAASASVQAPDNGGVKGVGSLDLVTLLIAYLEDDLRAVPASPVGTPGATGVPPLSPKK